MSECPAASALHCPELKYDWWMSKVSVSRQTLQEKLRFAAPTFSRNIGVNRKRHGRVFGTGGFERETLRIVENGRYRILGRMNIDILKTGGNKVSALEVEEQLREHPAIAECAVVGVPDSEWGERVAAAVVLREGQTLDLERLRSWAKERLASYKIPSRLLIVDGLPRNAMGKVTKPAIADLFKTPEL